eukprot:1142999-Pelagomonas_calceolata.AAC.3
MCGIAVTLHTILLGVGGTCYIEHTLNQFKQLGLDHQRAIILARKLHAHSVIFANKLVTTRRAMKTMILSKPGMGTMKAAEICLSRGAGSQPPHPASANVNDDQEGG